MIRGSVPPKVQNGIASLLSVAEASPDDFIGMDSEGWKPEHHRTWNGVEAVREWFNKSEENPLNKKLLYAISRILDLALENSCTCNPTTKEERRTSTKWKERGFLGHDKDCCIYEERDKIKAVTKFLTKQRMKK